ncbi:MAG: hypothetical protein H0T76_02965, partial [Nannocystis sp.]
PSLEIAMHRPACLALALAACRPVPARDLPICPLLKTAARAVEADSRVLPPDLWFRLLIADFDRNTNLAPADPRDCSQRPLLTADDGPSLPPRPRTTDDLSFGTSHDGALLVWARVFDYPDGTAIGPVVLARWVEQGLEFRGVGSLRAPARRVRLHLERLPAGQSLLVAEGEACPASPAESGEPCPREAVLLPLVDQRFLGADLLEGEAPIRPARLRLDERRDLPRPQGCTRRLEIHRRLDLHGPVPALHAAIRIRDCLPDTTCIDHLTLLDARNLELQDLTFITAEDPWIALLTQQTMQ